MPLASRVRPTPSTPGFLPRLPQFVLTRYLSQERVWALAQGTGWSGRRRVFDPYRVLFATVDQALGGQTSQSAVVSRQAAASGVALDRDSGALCRARRKVPASLPIAAAQDVFLTARDLVPGPRVWLVDGACVALSPTAANQARYPQSTTQPAGVGDPQLHLVALVDLATGCIAWLALGTLHDHDAKLARELWDRIPRGDIVVADRGFASYGLLAAAQRRGFYVVVRQHQRQLNQAALEALVDDRVETRRLPQRHPDWWDQDLPARLDVRVVRQRWDSGQVLALNTNLPADGWSTQQVLDLYAERRRVETRFCELKVTLGLEPLRAATPALAEKLLWHWVLALNLVHCLLTEASVRSGVARWRLSFEGALEALNAAALLPTADPELACNWVVEQITLNPLPNRRNQRRDEPRMLRRRHRAYPYMTKPREQYVRGRRRVA